MVLTPMGIEASLSNLVVCQVVFCCLMSMVRRSLGRVRGLSGVISNCQQKKRLCKVKESSRSWENDRKSLVVM